MAGIDPEAMAGRTSGIGRKDHPGAGLKKVRCLPCGFPECRRWLKDAGGTMAQAAGRSPGPGRGCGPGALAAGTGLQPRRPHGLAGRPGPLGSDLLDPDRHRLRGPPAAHPHPRGPFRLPVRGRPGRLVQCRRHVRRMRHRLPAGPALPGAPRPLLAGEASAPEAPSTAAWRTRDGPSSCPRASCPASRSRFPITSSADSAIPSGIS